MTQLFEHLGREVETGLATFDLLDDLRRRPSRDVESNDVLLRHRFVGRVATGNRRDPEKDEAQNRDDQARGHGSTAGSSISTVRPSYASSTVAGNSADTVAW